MTFDEQVQEMEASGMNCISSRFKGSVEIKERWTPFDPTHPLRGIDIHRHGKKFVATMKRSDAKGEPSDNWRDTIKSLAPEIRKEIDYVRARVREMEAIEKSALNWIMP